MKNSRYKKIAREIIKLEKIREFSKNKKAVEAAEKELSEIPQKYKLNLIDLLEIDELVQKNIK